MNKLSQPAGGHIIDTDVEWDVIVVGTGMGGAMAGRRIAEHGLKVLFLEKGPVVELSTGDGQPPPEDEAGRVRHGHWPLRFGTTVDEVKTDIFPALGCGVGGSTLLYAAALERLERHDVEAIRDLPHPTGGWPIGYDLLCDYYEQAEALLHVRGSPIPGSGPRIPMDRPPPMRESDAVLMCDLAAAGLEPYRMHVGIAYKPGCRECLGVVCLRACKSDARNCGVEPAMARGATLVTNAQVCRLDADANKITGVVYSKDDSLHRARAKMVVLAAGTLHSAPLLLASRSDRWPDGLANGSGLVGRNLMLHADHWVAIWPSRKATSVGPSKSIASRALYRKGDIRLGMIQGTGLSAGYGNILMFLYSWFDTSPFRFLRPLRPFLRIPAKVAEKLFGSATIMTLMMEDMPYRENRLELDSSSPSGIAIHYRFHDEMNARAKLARRLFRDAVHANRMFWLLPHALLNWGHPMGTCRFGSDPATSVLDIDCKAHELDNLYVADGSFMPTGGGVNPSLTIAANALRVADAIAARFRVRSAKPDLAEQSSLERDAGHDERFA